MFSAGLMRNTGSNPVRVAFPLSSRNEGKSLAVRANAKPSLKKKTDEAAQLVG
jgi:hypothetical protein